MAFAAPFYVPWSVAISRVIGGWKSPVGGLANIQLIGGVPTGVVTFVPATIWLIAAIRVEQYFPEIVQLYHFGWMFFDVTYVFRYCNASPSEFAILCDRAGRSRCCRGSFCLRLAYFLTAACYVPLSLMPFFPTGPVAWNGIVVWYSFFRFHGIGDIPVLARASALESDLRDLAAR